MTDEAQVLWSYHTQHRSAAIPCILFPNGYYDAQVIGVDTHEIRCIHPVLVDDSEVLVLFVGKQKSQLDNNYTSIVSFSETDFGTLAVLSKRHYLEFKPFSTLYEEFYNEFDTGCRIASCFYITRKLRPMSEFKPNDFDNLWKVTWPYLQQHDGYKLYHFPSTEIYSNKTSIEEEWIPGTNCFDSKQALISHVLESRTTTNNLNTSTLNTSKATSNRNTSNSNTSNSSNRNTSNSNTSNSSTSNSNTSNHTSKNFSSSNSRKDEKWSRTWASLKKGGWKLEVGGIYVRPGRTIESGEIMVDFFPSREDVELFLSQTTAKQDSQEFEEIMNFRELWKRCKALGGKSRAPSGLSTSFKYILPNGPSSSSSMEEGRDYFIGENALLSYWLHNGIIRRARTLRDHEYVLLSHDFQSRKRKRRCSSDDDDSSSNGQPQSEDSVNDLLSVEMLLELLKQLGGSINESESKYLLPNARQESNTEGIDFVYGSDAFVRLLLDWNVIERVEPRNNTSPPLYKLLSLDVLRKRA